jgi:hypothetical protein
MEHRLLRLLCLARPDVPPGLSVRLAKIAAPGQRECRSGLVRAAASRGPPHIGRDSAQAGGEPRCRHAGPCSGLCPELGRRGKTCGAGGPGLRPRPGANPIWPGRVSVILAAGLGPKPGATRLRLLERNFRCSALSSVRAPSLTARFRSLLGRHLGVAPPAVHAYVLGEHDDSGRPAWSAARAIAADEGAVRAGSTCSEGLGGIARVTLSLARAVGRRGITAELRPDLDPGETEAPAASGRIPRPDPGFEFSSKIRGHLARVRSHRPAGPCPGQSPPAPAPTARPAAPA